MLDLSARTHDLRHKENPEDRAGFDRVRRAERHYTMQLRKVARAVGDIVKGFPPGDPAAEPLIRRALRQYAELLQPWAHATAASMLADVSRRDEKVWRKITENMGIAMRLEIQNAPTGIAMRQLMAEEVTLITSLPLEAAQRVHELTIEGLSNATRAHAIKEEILKTGDVTESRALLIARTEVGRASGKITQTRAEHVDSPGYIWRTAGDSAVRPDHRKLEGKFIEWNKPPIADQRSGTRAHAGCIWNCRCFMDVVLPGEYTRRPRR